MSKISPISPLTDVAFVASMTALGPFEPKPHIAVGVSGGADSLGLLLLATRWAQSVGGRVTALTVDHGLSFEASAIAKGLQTTLQNYGFDSHILTNDEPAPPTGIEAFARSVRYKLLRQTCRQMGILHLLVAHTMEDQAETLLIRLGAGSGADGLAAISPIRELPDVRLLRPLLAVPKRAVHAVVKATGLEPWSDPMNDDPKFRRVQVRQASDSLADVGLTPERLAEAAAGFGRARQALETVAAKLIAHAVALSPLGYAVVDRARMGAAEDEVRARALARLIGAIGGRDHPPSPSRAEIAWHKLMQTDRSESLGGCVLMPSGQRLTLCREQRGKAAWVHLEAGGHLHWDGRFDVQAPADQEIWVRRADKQAKNLKKVPLLATKSLPLVRLKGTETLLYPQTRDASGLKVSAFRPRISLSAPGVTVV